MTTKITEAEIKVYFAKSMNGINEAEGHAPYTERQIDDCWATMHPEERVEWEDEALGDKMEREEIKC